MGCAGIFRWENHSGKSVAAGVRIDDCPRDARGRQRHSPQHGRQLHIETVLQK